MNEDPFPHHGAFRPWMGIAALLLGSALALLVGIISLEWAGWLAWERFPRGVGMTPISMRLTVPDQRVPPASQVRMIPARESYESDEMGRKVTYRTIPFPASVELGMRDDGVGGAIEGVVLGDSFTFGAFVDLNQTFPELLERNLGVDVLNMGVGSYGPDQSLHILRRYVSRLQTPPKWILYAFYEGNDLIDLSSGRNFQVKHLGNYRQWLDDHSVFYRLAKHVAFGVRSQAQAEMRQYVFKGSGLEIAFRPSLVRLNSPRSPSDSFEATLRTLSGILSEMRSISETLGSEFGVILIPYKEQVYRERMFSVAPFLRDADLELPASRIEAFCREGSIPALNLIEPFRAHSGEQLYFTSDDHWNGRGHALAAQAIREWLETNPLRMPLAPK